MNFAAYLDQKGKKVLLVDLDHQGSLSNAMLSAAGIEDVESKVDELFSKELSGTEVIQLTTGLREMLPRTRIITAFMSFGRLESKAMMKWLLDDAFTTDIRHVIAKALRTPEVRRQFDVVIFDCPPRLTTGTVNALCASTHLLIPTGLDGMAAEAVAPTLKSVKRLASRLNSSLQLLGVVGNLSRQDELSEKEEMTLEMAARALATEGWGNARMFQRTIPRRAAVSNAAGVDIAYLADHAFKQLFDELGDEIAAVLWEAGEPEALPEQTSPMPARGALFQQPAVAPAVS